MKLKIFASLSAFCLVGIVPLFAQGVVGNSSGNCGTASNAPCTLGQLGSTIKAAGVWALSLGMIAMTGIIAFKIAKIMIAREKNQASEISDAKKSITNMIVGVMLFALLLGSALYITILGEFGVNGGLLRALKIISELNEPFINIAYAQNLANPTSHLSVSSIIVTVVGLMLQWFVYPAVFVAWIWSGFQLVVARGNPAAIASAKKRLLVVLLCTIALFMVATFISTMKTSLEALFV